MKWRSESGRRKDEQERKESLVNVPRKAFAWLPTITCNDSVVWLQWFWSVYVREYPTTSPYYNHITEYTYESLEAAERAKK